MPLGGGTGGGVGFANPMTTQSDLIVGDSGGSPIRLPKGADGQVLTVDPSTHQLIWANPATGFSNPMTTRGDVLIEGAGPAAARLPIGAAGKVIRSDGTDPSWQTLAEADLATTDVTTINVTSTKHGLAPKAPADATKFLNGAATPAYASPKDTDLATTDVTGNNVGSTKHGFAPKSPADATQFLNGAATPAYAAVKDTDLATTDVTGNNVTISKHGFAPKAPNDATKYLDGTGAYSTPSGGGGSYRPYIDTIALDGTYGDDFTAASLDGKWTPRNQASESFQLGGGTWMQYDITNASDDRGQFFQTDGSGDMELILTFARSNFGATGEMFGPTFVDASGNGIAVCFYDNTAGMYLVRLATYVYTSTSGSISLFDKSSMDGATVYLGLRVVGTTFDARYSLNGFTWSEYCQSDSYGFTRNRLGFGRFLGTPTHDRIAVDRFNKI